MDVPHSASQHCTIMANLVGSSMQIVQYEKHIVGSPEVFTELLRPIGGETRVHKTTRHQAHFNIELARLNRVSIFSVTCKTPYTVSAAAGRPIIGLTIPVHSRFKANINGVQKDFSGFRAHVLCSRDTFRIQFPEKNRVLVCNVDDKTIQDSVQRLNQDEIRGFDQNTELSLAHGYGAYLHRYLNFLQGEVRRYELLLDNELFSRELEASVITAYSLALTYQHAGKTTNRQPLQAPLSVRRAEEFISANLLNPVCLADLADAAGLPARTLLRLFKRHHGMSPMKFLRHRRYDAAHTDLIHAERYETSVTEIAFKYGFSCAGRFAKEYHEIFHELPSETLKKE